MGIAIVVVAMATSVSADGGALLLEAERAIVRGRAALVAGPDLAGERSYGEQALALLATLRSGEPLDSPQVDRSLRAVLSRARVAITEDYGGAYLAGLVLCVLEELGERSRVYAPPDLVAALTRRLVELQRADGGWGDVSRTEFAAVGLDAAERLGAHVAGDVWDGAVRYLQDGQNGDGGWGYKSVDPSTGSMTAAAVVTMLCAGHGIDSPAVARGIGWLRRRFRPDTNPGFAKASASTSAKSHTNYYLAALASLATSAGGWPVDAWARLTSRRLVDAQTASGAWRGDALDCPTAFSVLFLVAARSALAGLPSPRAARIGVVPTGGRSISPAAVNTISLALLRWSEMRGGVELLTLAPGAPVDTRLPLVIVLSSPDGHVIPGVANALATYVASGGGVFVEGLPGSSPDAVAALATSILHHRRDRAVSPGALRRAVASLPIRAPYGSTTPPRVLDIRDETDRILVAPQGLFSLLGGEGLGVRSGTARMAVNVLSCALSR